MDKIDELCPDYVGEPRIVLRLRADPTLVEVPRADQTVDISVDYSATLPDDVVLPLDLTVAGPSEDSTQWREYTLFQPDLIVFIPTEPGRHVVTLRERHHNNWYGSLEIDVL